MPQMFQQALWISGTDREDRGQEVDLEPSVYSAYRPGSSRLITLDPAHMACRYAFECICRKMRRCYAR
jgi:hypothetical protein